MPNGDPVLTFSVGSNETWSDSGGNKRERCEWVNCTIFGKRASAVAQYMTKGKRVIVDGKLRTDKVERDGETKFFTKLIVDSLTMIGDGQGARDDGDAKPAQQSRYGKSGHGGSAKHSAPPDRDPHNGAETDEIPF